MVRSYMWLFFIVAITLQLDLYSMQDNLTSEDTDLVSINRGTHLTFRRYYFISRLDRTMRLLLKIQSTQRMSFSRALRSIHFDISLFNDKRIIRSLKRIQETRSLKPLFMIWDDFIAYKSLEDDVFIEDFSKEIFVITRTVLSSLDEHGVDNNTLWLPQLTHTAPNKTEQLLNAIDEITHMLQQIVPHNAQQYKNALHAPPLDLKSEVSSDEIALRFYYIKRLQKAVNIIRNTETKAHYRNIPHEHLWRSPGIDTLLRAMQETGSHAPMMHTWDEVNEYKFIDNLKFIKEFMCVVFLTLRHVYMGITAPEIPMNQSNIEKLNIEDVLHAIDIITDQVSSSAHIYEEYSPQDDQEWFTQYWWLAPFTLGSIIVRWIYYHYTGHKPLNHHMYGNNYNIHTHYSQTSHNQSLSFK